MLKKCIKIKTNNAEFYTKKDNLEALKRFVELSKYQVSTTMADEKFILGIDDLSRIICEEKYNQKSNSFHCNKSNLVNNKKMTQKHIERLLLTGEVVSLNDIRSVDDLSKLTSAYLCNNFKLVRKKMTDNGKTIIRHSRGVYQMID